MARYNIGSVGSIPKSNRRRDVFISHASKDVEIARRLCSSLEQSGWSVFLAARDLPGELESADWSQRIDEALDSCGTLVLLVSPEALEKKWVTYEWRSFHDDILADRGGWLVPCCIRDLAPDQLGRALRRYQVVDIRKSKDWESGIVNLVDIIEGYLKQPIDHHPESAKRSVLTIEGTGLRTFMIIPVLERLETALIQDGGKCLADYLDLIVGNSLGGALAALLAQGKNVIECRDKLTYIVNRSFQKRGFLNFAKLNSRYSSARLIDILTEVFRDLELSSVPKCAISTFDITKGEHHLWAAHSKLGITGDGPSLALLTAASVAAPTFFDPIYVGTNEKSRHLLLDGALWESDPGRIGLEAVRRLFSPTPLISDIVHVSIGSGQLPTTVTEKRVPNLLNWVTLLPNVLLNANRQLVLEHIESLYRDRGVVENYSRFDPELTGIGSFSAFDPNQVPYFLAFGADWAESRSDQIQEAAQQLIIRGFDTSI